jgi:hypothetical protein
VTQQVQLEKKEAEDTKNPEQNGKDQSRSHSVSRERIERLKRAFRPTWLHEMINGPDKTSNSKKDK